MAAFLFKTEPSDYSFAALQRDKNTAWAGVSNALALIHLRSVRSGDSVVIYHTGAEKRAVGLAKATSDPYADPALDDPKRVVVDVQAVRAFATPVALATFRTDSVLRTTDLVRNSRLSAMPLKAAQLARVLKLAGG